QVAATLRHLAAIEERHASWLRDRLQARGADVPEVEPVELVGRNQWERAGEALRHAQQKRRRLVEHITRSDPEERAAVELFQRIEQEEARGLPMYEAIVMRSDPQALD